MAFEEKTPDLLALLTAHTGGASPVVPMVPRPPTLVPTHASFGDATNKKRKKGAKELRKGKSLVLHSSPQPNRPKKPRPNRKRLLPLGPLKALRESNSQSALLGDPHLLWARGVLSWMMPTKGTPRRVGQALWPNVWKKLFAYLRSCRHLGPFGNVRSSSYWRETLPRYIITLFFS